MESSDKIDRILDAAAVVINRAGCIKATIDEIAAEASISKGGFLHYFPSKRACFLALIERSFNIILENAHTIAVDLPDAPGRMLKAYVISLLRWQESPHSVQIIRFMEDEELREVIAKYRLRRFELVHDERIPEITMRTVLLMCTGLWTTSRLREETARELADFRQILQDRMMVMIDQSVNGGGDHTAESGDFSG